MAAKKAKPKNGAKKYKYADAVERRRLVALAAAAGGTGAAPGGLTAPRSPVPDADGYTQVTMYLPQELFLAVEAHARASFQSRSEALRSLVVSGLRVAAAAAAAPPMARSGT